MKQIQLVLFLSLFFTSLFAQRTLRVEQLGDNQRAETHAFMLGGDSVRYTILGKNDTLTTDVFWYNGQMQSRSWKKDSVYYYRQFGQLIAKRYYFQEKNKPTVSDSIAFYLSDGSLIGMEIFRNNKRTSLSFGKDGQVENKRAYIYEASPHYFAIENNTGKAKATHAETQKIGRDSFRVVFDTSFYPNNQIRTLEQTIEPFLQKADFYDYYQNKRYVKREYYSPNGQLLLALPPDSLQLLIFKDNLNCFYGLKNRRGDTIIAPRFDNIEKAGDNFFICEDGINKMLMRADGSIVKQGKMETLKAIGTNNTYIHSSENEETFSFLSHIRPNPTLFVYSINNKYGVFDTSGRTILPPQYSEIMPDRQGDFFIFQESAKGVLQKLGLIDSASGKIVGEGRFPFVRLTTSSGFFVFSDSVKYSYNRNLGLMNRQGDILLPQKYLKIEPFTKDLFWVKEVPKNVKLDYEFEQKAKIGLYDVKNKRWVLQPIFKTTTPYWNPNIKTTILYDTEKRQTGMMDSTGQWFLPPVYDTIIDIGGHKLILSQRGQFTVFDTKQRKNITQAYQNLGILEVYNNYPVNLPNYSSLQDANDAFYIAQKQGKWGVINQDEKTIVPFEYDYAGFKDFNLPTKALVKNNKVFIYDRDFFPKPMPENYIAKAQSQAGENSFKMMDDPLSIFEINDKGDVIIPPQYKIVSTYFTIENGRYSKHPIKVIENKQGKRKIVFQKKGDLIDFPFSEPLLWANEMCPLVLLGKQNDKSGIRVANLKTGKVIKHVKKGGLSIGDNENGTFFAKTNAPPLPSKIDYTKLPVVFKDTLAMDDNGWLMFNAEGRQISKDTFRFPIPFYEHIGWGMVGEKYGLWQSDGKAITPPQYENAFRDTKRGIFAFFQNIGLKNWLVLFDKHGKTLVNTGRYDGISDFYGKYAVVKNEGKLGLIDSLGNEIVPLTDVATAYHTNFRDSLGLMNTENTVCNHCDTIYRFGRIDVINYDVQDLPINIFHRYPSKNEPDSLKLSESMRNIVWNRLIEVFMRRTFHTAAATKVEKAEMFKTYLAYYSNDRDREEPFRKQPKELLFDLFVDSQRLAFSVLKDTTDRAVYYNFEKKDGAWGPLSINTFLKLNPDNTQKINDLLAEKIKAMKDVDIDCGTSTSFWERGQNTYLVRKDGIVFYFLTKLKGFEKDQRFNSLRFEKIFVPILLPWAELKPFLK